MGQCNCENREHHFLLTTTKSVWTLPPAISDFHRKPHSGMEVFDGERSVMDISELMVSSLTSWRKSHGHQIPQYSCIEHLWDLKHD